jgi:hypothetical protein
VKPEREVGVADSEQLRVLARLSPEQKLRTR